MRQRRAFGIQHVLVAVHLPGQIDFLRHAFADQLVVFAQGQVGLVQLGTLERQVQRQQQRHQPDQKRRGNFSAVAKTPDRGLAMVQLLDCHASSFRHFLDFDRQRGNWRALAALTGLRHRLDFVKQAAVRRQLADAQRVVGEQTCIAKQLVDVGGVHRRLCGRATSIRPEPSRQRSCTNTARRAGRAGLLCR